MKTLEWQNFFADQRAQHAKVVFSVAELANAAQTSLHAVNTELGRLVGRGIIHRYAHGRYGPTQGVAHPVGGCIRVPTYWLCLAAARH